jgi:serine phosphatase RsbU (regulator of sigma subunit)/Tfp pilus assembly protein PilF
MNFRRNILQALCLLFSCLVFISLSAQKEKADSIKKLLVNANDSLKFNLLINLSEAYSNYSPRNAVQTAKDATALADQLGIDSLKARAARASGVANYSAGYYPEALIAFQSAARIYKQLGMLKEEGSVYVKMGDTYTDQGSYNEALSISLEGYKIYDSLGLKQGMAGALIVSGNVYRFMHNYNKSILDFEKAFSISKDENDLMHEASSLNNLAITYGEAGDTLKEIDYYEQSRVIFKKLGDKKGEGQTLNNIGAIYLEKPDFEKALQYFQMAEELRKEIGDKLGLSSTLTNLGTVWYLKDNYDKALEYYFQAFEIAQSIGAGEAELNICSNISETYKMKGDFEDALKFNQRYSDLKDSVYSATLSEKIADKQAQYDVAKAEGDSRANKLQTDAAQKEKKLIAIAAGVFVMLLVVVIFFLWNRAVTRKRTNITLNQQKNEIENKNTELHAANLEIELKNKDITDSIQYARRIQEAILPEVEFNATFGDTAFVLYRPKDIVSGDLYWMAQSGDYVLFAAVDCTGHGVPGAFVSIVCSNLLSQSVKEHGLIRPDEILNDVNIRLSETLRQRQDTSRVRDGMDIALCSLNKKTLHLTYAGAFNPAWIFHGKEFIELTPDKFPVGLFEEEELRKFSFKEIQLSPGDRIYVFSDGYSDQFGGQLGKKYKRSTFCDFVKNMQHESIKMQGRLLDQEHLRWKGQNEQIDDILIIGIQV